MVEKVGLERFICLFSVEFSFMMSLICIMTLLHGSLIVQSDVDHRDLLYDGQ